MYPVIFFICSSHTKQSKAQSLRPQPSPSLFCMVFTHLVWPIFTFNKWPMHRALHICIQPIKDEACVAYTCPANKREAEHLVPPRLFERMGGGAPSIKWRPLVYVARTERCMHNTTSMSSIKNKII